MLEHDFYVLFRELSNFVVLLDFTIDSEGNIVFCSDMDIRY
jgi:hypothetical protein